MATFPELLANKKLKTGTYLGEFATPGIGHMLKNAGCDFAFVDMEHSGFTFETVKALLRHLTDLGIANLVRPPSKEAHHISRACDVGAQGLIPPMLSTEQQAQDMAASVKYPPEGMRGAAFGIAHDDYRAMPVADAIQQANSKTSAVALIETADGVRNVDAIASTPGVDCLWLGHFDLSNSLGVPGGFDTNTFLDAVEAVMNAGRTADKSIGRLVGSPDEAERLFGEGCDFICYSGDVWLYSAALSDGITAIRDRIGNGSASGA